jgi:hypothetical protein
MYFSVNCILNMCLHTTGLLPVSNSTWVRTNDRNLWKWIINDWFSQKLTQYSPLDLPDVIMYALSSDEEHLYPVSTKWRRRNHLLLSKQSHPFTRWSKCAFILVLHKVDPLTSVTLGQHLYVPWRVKSISNLKRSNFPTEGPPVTQGQTKT